MLDVTKIFVSKQIAAIFHSHKKELTLEYIMVHPQHGSSDWISITTFLCTRANPCNWNQPTQHLLCSHVLDCLAMRVIFVWIAQITKEEACPISYENEKHFSYSADADYLITKSIQSMVMPKNVITLYIHIGVMYTGLFTERIVFPYTHPSI